MDKAHAGRNLTQQLVHTLGAAIVQGKYPEGTGLPSEAELCEEFEISRSATREAVKMLTAKGLLSSRPRQGIKVQSKTNWNLFDPDVLEWVLRGTLTLELLKEFLQLRLAIEPEASALAAENQNLDNIALIDQALQRMKAAEAGLDDPLEADIAFHMSVLMASDNPFFQQLRNFIDTALRVSIRFTNRIKGVQAADHLGHKQVYDAIKQGDSEAARTASRSLQSEALDLIKKEIESR